MDRRKPFTILTARVAVVNVDNIDTDQIYPSRYLTVIDREGLARYLFADWRYDEEGATRPGFALNREGASTRRILLVGENFGGGSSREHAAWALTGFGFRAVIAGSFADIFRANALKNGLLPVKTEPGIRSMLLRALEEKPDAEVTIDLENRTVTLPDGTRASFPVDEFSRSCLLQGLDPLGYLLEHREEIEAYESGHQPPYDTRAAV